MRIYVMRITTAISTAVIITAFSFPAYAGKWDGLTDAFSSSSRNWDSHFSNHSGRVTHTQYNELADGSREVDRFNPARNEGYGKVYTNRIDADGNASKYNVTVGPNGVINGRPM